MRRLILAVLCLQLLSAPLPEPAKYVALTFDDGPSGRYTRRLLDGLEERNVKATFLLCGYRIEQYPEETTRILREGHEVGCHGFTHKKMNLGIAFSLFAVYNSTGFQGCVPCLQGALSEECSLPDN